METEVGPPNISIFEFLLNDHHAQIKSTLQDLFRRSTFLHHGNHSLLTLKSNIVQSKHDHYHYLDLNPLTPRFRFSHRSALLSESTSRYWHNRNRDLLEENFPAQRTPNIDINPDQIRSTQNTSNRAPNRIHIMESK